MWIVNIFIKNIVQFIMCFIANEHLALYDQKYKIIFSSGNAALKFISTKDSFCSDSSSAIDK